jgi:hypothetical protein
MKTEKLNEKAFEEILNELNVPNDIDKEYLFEIYDAVVDGINMVMSTVTNYKFIPVNHVVVVLYIVNEYLYSVNNLIPEKKKEFINDENLSSALASVCCDKYLTNEQLNYKSKTFLNRFNPPISTLCLYLNFTLTTIEKIQVKDNVSELIKRMLFKAFSLSKCITELLLGGYETEAFSTWRTLHENESIMTCLMKYGEPMFKEYFKHITYVLAYRHQMSQEEQDKIFLKIKEEMKLHDLKSKDMKKFIEYGYLYVIEDFDEKQLKLNFRDGVEKAAGLESYSKVYEMCSEIAHSSPLLLLSDKTYFMPLTLLNLYESFFRLEKIFESYFKVYSSKEDFAAYEKLKGVYMNQLVAIYNDTKERFLNMQSKNLNDNSNKS